MIALPGSSSRCSLYDYAEHRFTSQCPSKNRAPHISIQNTNFYLAPTPPACHNITAIKGGMMSTTTQSQIVHNSNFKTGPHAPLLPPKAHQDAPCPPQHAT